MAEVLVFFFCLFGYILKLYLLHPVDCIYAPIKHFVPSFYYFQSKNRVHCICVASGFAEVGKYLSFFTKACKKAFFHWNLKVKNNEDGNYVVHFVPYSGLDVYKLFLVPSSNPCMYTEAKSGLVGCSRYMLVGCNRYRTTVSTAPGGLYLYPQ